MPKIILFSIFWGFFWEAIVFGFSGFYFFPVLAAAIFISYSPLIIKAANILIAGAILWILMFLWVFIISNFQTPSTNFIFHISFYATFSLAFTSLIYVFEKK